MRYNGEVESLAADSLISIASVVVPPPKYVDPSLFLATPVKSGGLTVDTTPSDWSDGHQEVVTADDGRRDSHASMPAEDIIEQQDARKESDEIAEGEGFSDTPMAPPIVIDEDTDNDNEGEQETIEYQAYLHSVSSAASQEASSSLPVDSPVIRQTTPYNPFDEDVESPRVSELRTSEDSESVVCKVAHTVTVPLVYMAIVNTSCFLSFPFLCADITGIPATVRDRHQEDC